VQLTVDLLSAAAKLPHRRGKARTQDLAETTHTIERNHCRQRHWFERFKRKSIIVSKAKNMVDLTIALFARFRVNGDVAEIFTLDMITEAILSIIQSA
jgi:hypothetical protein